MQVKDGHVAKFMPRFDRPYEIIKAHPESSSYTLKLPPSSKAHPTFHVLHLQKHVPNDDELFLSQALHPQQPLVTANGTTEYFIDKIIDR